MRLRFRLVILLCGAVGVYGLALVGLYLEQRRLMYFPTPGAMPASAMGLDNTATLQLATPDGETIMAWYRPASEGHPLFLYFHGNGGRLADRAAWLGELAADGSGFLAIDYRGYGGSTGTPSEQGLLIDGRTAYAKARALGYPAARIVVIGESLGTGVAVAVAAEHPIRALVLDSAFSATADVAAATYWMFPVEALMRDRFRSDARIGLVTAPKLFLHGSDDPIIPIAYDRKLFAAAHDPKTFIAVAGAGHIVLLAPAVLASMKAWLAAHP